MTPDPKPTAAQAVRAFLRDPYAPTGGNLIRIAEAIDRRRTARAETEPATEPVTADAGDYPEGA